VETVSGEVVKKEEISMRKRIIGHGPGEVAAAEPGWMDLEGLAQVEITSEDVDFSIESEMRSAPCLFYFPLSN
jgi:hypothetical protein